MSIVEVIISIALHEIISRTILTSLKTRFKVRIGNVDKEICFFQIRFLPERRTIIHFKGDYKLLILLETCWLNSLILSEEVLTVKSCMIACLL